MPETVTTFCRICEAVRGRRVRCEYGKVVPIEPDSVHVAPDSWSGIAPD